MPWRAWPDLLRNRAVLGMLGFSFFAGLSNDTLFVVFGVWLEESFNLSLTALGAGAGVIGLAELAGAFLVAAAGDRMGLRNAMVWGMALYVLCTAALPLFGASLSLSLLGLFLVFLTFEFTVVACLSLATSLAPGLTATFMSGYLVAFSAGRLVGALLGVPIWRAGGLWATGLSAAAFALAGLAGAAWVPSGAAARAGSGTAHERQ
jgi:predicted MFS family arabinose efflux permease